MTSKEEKKITATPFRLKTVEELMATPVDPAYLRRIEHARELAQEARKLDMPPRYECHDSVKVRGEPLSRPIYWQGRQWAVTAYGVEARDGRYVIELNRVCEHDDKYTWIRHMAGKTWVDIDDFAEALRIARQRLRDQSSQ